MAGVLPFQEALLVQAPRQTLAHPLVLEPYQGLQNPKGPLVPLSLAFYKD